MMQISERENIIQKLMAEDGITRRAAEQQVEDLPHPTEEQWLAFDILVQAAREERLLLVPSMTTPGRVYIAARSHDDPQLVLTLAQIDDDPEEVT